MGASSLDFVLQIIEPEVLKAMRAAAGCEPLINAGFTTVRDAGGYGVYVKRALNEGTIKHGPALSPPIKCYHKLLGTEMSILFL